MKRVLETAECEQVRSSILLAQRKENHENQIKGLELKVSN